MVKISSLLIAGLLAAGMPIEVSAQGIGTALSEARVRLACGTGRVLGAEALPNGTIRVTCEQQVASSAAAATGLPRALEGGTLSPGLAGGAAAAAVLLIIAIGDDDTSSSTTSTPSEPSEFKGE